MSKLHHFLEGPSCLREPDGPVVCPFAPCYFFCQHLPPKDSVFMDLINTWMASAGYSLSSAADDCSSVSGRTLNHPPLLLSDLASTNCLGHPAGTVLGNPCPYCSLLVESLLNVRKETLIFCSFIFQGCEFWCGACRGYFSAKNIRRLHSTLEISSLVAEGTLLGKAEMTSRLPATQLFKILQEKSFLSMQVQYLSIISWQTLTNQPSQSCTKVFWHLSSLTPSSGSFQLLLQSLCPSLWTTAATARNSQAMNILFPHALDGALFMLPSSLQIKWSLLHSIHFLTVEYDLVSRKGNIVLWLVVKKRKRWSGGHIC